MTRYSVKETDLDPDRTARVRVPHVVPGCDLRKLPLSTIEAYVFSRIDGTMAEDDLVVCTGLEATIVANALDRLASFGALSFSDPVPRRTVSQTQTRAQSSAAPRSTSQAAPARTDAPRATTDAPRSRMETARTYPDLKGVRSEVPPRVQSVAPPHSTTAPPARPSTQSQFVVKPPMRTTTPAPAPGMSTAPPPRTSVSPSAAPRALTPVPTTYRPGSMRPEHGDTMRRYLEGARLAIAEGNAAAAANYYRLAQQLAPSDTAIGTALASCSTASADARATNDRAATLILLGDNAARAKQWGVAAQAYEEAASLMAKDATVLYKLAGALYRCGGQLSRANQLVEESIVLSRTRVEAWLLLAQIRWESGARTAAREAAEEARRLRPDDERVIKLITKFGSVR